MQDLDFIQELAAELKKRDNPSNMYPSYIGTVSALSPIEVKIKSGKITLIEGHSLLISSQFKIRLNMDKKLLLEDTNELLNNAKNTSETHSYGGANCQMPQAVSSNSDASENIRDEFIKYKIHLNIGDKVSILSAENNIYILADKLL